MRGDDGAAYLVKFSPPQGTPFGERWHDLLCAEALSSAVLNRHGFAAAPGTIVQTATRTYLLSQRFDRCTTQGRRHVVSVGEAHAAFVKGPYGNWAQTCDALARQKRLDAHDAELAHSMLQFGRLIGNTDMHSGNASLFVKGVTLAEMVQGHFTWAPVYDMLPMRWKPDPMMGQRWRNFGSRPYERFGRSGSACPVGFDGKTSTNCATQRLMPCCQAQIREKNRNCLCR